MLYVFKLVLLGLNAESIKIRYNPWKHNGDFGQVMDLKKIFVEQFIINSQKDDIQVCTAILYSFDYVLHIIYSI